MNAREMKIARKFKLSAAEVAELSKAGLDTPTKIKQAKPEELPEGLRDKLTHSREKRENVTLAELTSGTGSAPRRRNKARTE
jgi:hypothetical protein